MKNKDKKLLLTLHSILTIIKKEKIMIRKKRKNKQNADSDCFQELELCTITYFSINSISVG